MKVFYVEPNMGKECILQMSLIQSLCLSHILPKISNFRRHGHQVVIILLHIDLLCFVKDRYYVTSKNKKYTYEISLWFPSKHHSSMGPATEKLRLLIVLPQRRATAAGSTRRSDSLTRWYETLMPSTFSRALTCL